MRTTRTIDDDVLAAAGHQADRDHRTVGEAISALARQALTRPAGGRKKVRNGIPLLPVRRDAPAAALDLVNQMRDEEP